MIFGLEGFTWLHVAVSLVGLFAGFMVLGAFLTNTELATATHVFLWTTVATNVTSFGFPFTQILPSHVVAAVSLVVLAIAVYAYYGTPRTGGWRTIYVASATAALYLNVFVLIAQMFAKMPQLNALAPTNSEPTFAVSQAVALIAFAVLGLQAVRSFKS